VSDEYAGEPIPGLPGHLPPGEVILWQGSPDWLRLARDAFKTRWIAGYFAVLLLWALFDGNATGLVMTLGVGALGVALLHLLAWLVARATIYTLTNRRIVFRFGVALQKCVNVPLVAIGSAGLHRNADGSGDIPLLLTQAHRLGYVQFWPNVRPWKLGQPEPMIRSVPDVDTVAQHVASALLAVHPAGAPVSGDRKQTPMNSQMVPA
jgi:hypothetical protein